MKRGDLIITVLQGDYGKPRPALIVQSDLFTTRDSIIICPITTHLVETSLRVTLIPSERNGLKEVSQIMIDKIMAVKKTKVQQNIGYLSLLEMEAINHNLKHWLGLE